MVFTVGALLAGASPFTSRGRRLRLRIQKQGDKFWAEIRKREEKSFWAGDRPSSPRILPTGVHWWRTGRPRHVRAGACRAEQGQGELQGEQRCKAGPTSWNVGLPHQKKA